MYPPPIHTPARRVILCDFDGTAGSFTLFLDYLTRFCAPAHEAILADFLARKINTEEVVRRGLALSRATPSETRAYLNSIRLDPDFAPFVELTRRRGYELYIVSDSLESFIRAVLSNHGLSGLPVLSNYLEQDDAEFNLHQPWRDANCPLCRGVFGVCKLRVCRSFQADGCTVTLIGDGMTDECAASAADRVFATGSLWAYCQERRIKALPFQSFADIRAALEGE